MKFITAGTLREKASAIIQGCMRINALSLDEIEALIQNDLELGINFFDHADIYKDGLCEEKFGQVLKRNPGLREKVILQSKCGIVRGDGHNYFDFFKRAYCRSSRRQPASVTNGSLRLSVAAPSRRFDGAGRSCSSI